MALTREEARAALNEVRAAERSLAEQSQYAFAGPILILWGVVWIVGNGFSQFAAAGQATWAWCLLDVFGFAGTVAAARRRPRAASMRNATGAGIALAIFVVCLFAVLPPSSARQVDAAISLVIAVLYILGGLAGGARFIWLGAGLAATVMLGFFVLAAWFYLWMAIVGGGALVIGGLWLKRA